MGIARLFRPGAGADALLPKPLADLADLLDAAEERAAIMEHDGGLSRAEAEAVTLAAVIDLDVARRLRARWAEDRS